MALLPAGASHGGAASESRAAALHFPQVRVIAAIGDDQWRDIIWSAFEEIGVHARLVALKDADLVGTPREGTFIHYGSPD